MAGMRWVGDRYVVVDGVARSYRSNFPNAPATFDLLNSSVDNAGNYIHAEAPFNFWKQRVVNLVDGRRLPQRDLLGLDVSVEYANDHNAIFVLSAANFIQYDGLSEKRRRSYQSLEHSLAKLKVPLIVLGLGAQAPRKWNPTTHTLPDEAVSLLQFLSERAELVSLRGRFSEQVANHFTDGGNFVVTGCPSFYQSPSAFSDLKNELSHPSGGRPSFSLTNFGKPAERSLFVDALRSGHIWIDVRRPEATDTNRWLRSMNTANDDPLPGCVRAVPRVSISALAQGGHQHFDQSSDWIEYCRTHVNFSYGTRLHANMATLLAGKPAIWLTHDQRTIEATEYFNLPTLNLTQAQEWDFTRPPSASTFDRMFDVVEPRFAHFNYFLREAGLPEVELPVL